MGYDEAGRITSIPGILDSVSYDAAGRPLDQRNANATLTTRRYWPQRGLPQLLHTIGPGGTIQQLEYEQYDPVGLLQKVTSAIDGESWQYGYDDGYRLTTATNLTQPAESQSFDYDAIDRITASSRYGVYSYPPAGDPHPHAPTAVSGIPLSYDPNGNTLAAGRRSVVWNADDLPIQVTLGTLTTSFVYDGLGGRVKKSSAAGESLYPFGDEYEITGGVVTKYITVDGLGAIAKRVTGGPAPGTYWLHTDRQGSIQAVTDASGSAVFRRTYRPYGETLAEGGAHTESRGWIDQRNDTETGLTYLHARYFDPQLGVFLSPDPIGIAGGMNAYTYASGDPVNFVDPSGFAECPDNQRDCERGRADPSDSDPNHHGWFVFNASLGGAGAGSGIGGLVFLLFDDGVWGAIGRFFGIYPSGMPPSSYGAPHPSTEVEFQNMGRELPPEYPVQGPAEPVVVPPMLPSPVGAPSPGSERPTNSGFFSDPLYHSAQYCAGFGDCMTFGVTGYIRAEWGIDDVIDRASTGYVAGVYTEIGAEVGLTGLSYGLRAAARGVSQAAARRGLSRHGIRGLSELHHKNALKEGLFPTAALPRAIRHARLNTRLLSIPAHRAAHRTLSRHSPYLVMAFNPAMTAGRIGYAGFELLE